jgi:hypothetical protein
MTQCGSYYNTPPGAYPVHLRYPEFNTLGLWFPAMDAWTLEFLCEKRKQTAGQQRLSIMEIGSYVGLSTAVLARHASYLLCVDTWAGSGKADDEMAELYDGVDVLEVFKQNTTMFPVPPAFHRRTLNPDSLPPILEGYKGFDLIFIDAGHDYESVKADIEVAKTVIKPGGIICGHDYTQFPGVEQAAFEFGVDGVCGTVWWKEMER